METLESVFPAVPPAALQRVLEICDGDVETASEWVLENNWRDLFDNDDDVVDVDDDNADDTNAQTQQRRTGRDDVGRSTSTEANGAAAATEQSYVRDHTLPRLAFAHENAGAAPPNNAPVAAAPDRETTLGLTISGDSAAARTGSSALPFQHGSSATASRHQHHHDHVGSATTASTAAAPALVGRALGRPDDRDFESGGEHDGESDDYDEDEDEDEDDDDDDDDDDDAHSYYDSGDDVFYHGSSSNSAGSVLPLAKRVKVTDDNSSSNASAAAAMRDPKQEMYWVAFDGYVVRKTLIELLNTTLSKLAHSKVTLLNKSTKHIEELEAKKKLVSVLEVVDANATSTSATASASTSAATGVSRRTGIDHILNDADATTALAVPAASGCAAVDTKVAPLSALANGQKRKRSTDESNESLRAPLGFFAHFFSVNDLDMIWRSVMHAHLFNARFGEMIEFHTASCGAFNKRDFDELMHIQANIVSSRPSSLGLSPAAALKCCLILPCVATESEIFRVGKHLHSLLKLQGALYYRPLDDPVVTSRPLTAAAASSAASGTPFALASSAAGTGSARSTRIGLLNEDGKMTEDSFRRFARYRIKKEEQEAAAAESKEAHALTSDHFLAYQQQRKVEYCLQVLEAGGWNRRQSS